MPSPDADRESLLRRASPAYRAAVRAAQERRRMRTRVNAASASADGGDVVVTTWHDEGAVIEGRMSAATARALAGALLSAARSHAQRNRRTPREAGAA